MACVNTNRNFIGIELDETYFQIAKKRIGEAQNKPEQSKELGLENREEVWIDE